MTEGPGQVQTGVPGGAAGEDTVTERTAAPSAEPGQRPPRVLTPQQGRDQVCTPPVTAPYNNTFLQRQHGADALAAWAPGHLGSEPVHPEPQTFIVSCSGAWEVHGQGSSRVCSPERLFRLHRRTESTSPLVSKTPILWD